MLLRPVHETPAATLPDRGRPPRPERLGGRRGLAYLAARGLQADPRPRGRARRRGLRAPRQAPGGGHRAGQGGAGDRRAHPRRGAEPAPRRRGVRQRPARHPDDRHDAHPGALRAAQGGGRVQAALPDGAAGASTRAIRRRSASRCSPARPTCASPPRRSRSTPSWCRCRCYQWNRCVVVPPKHPLLKASPLTLEALARVPDRDLRLRLRQPLAGAEGLRERAASRRTSC